MHLRRCGQSRQLSGEVGRRRSQSRGEHAPLCIAILPLQERHMQRGKLLKFRHDVVVDNEPVRVVRQPLAILL